MAVRIIKELRQSALKPRIVATDSDPLSFELFRPYCACVLPRIADDQVTYLGRLIEICHIERIAMVCFGSEFEMRRLAVVTEDVVDKREPRDTV